MPRKTYTPEQINNKLREAEIHINQGISITEASRKIGITELAQPKSTEVILADESLDVANMLPKPSDYFDIILEFESEPRRNRTSNLLIKRLLAEKQPVAC